MNKKNFYLPWGRYVKIKMNMQTKILLLLPSKNVYSNEAIAKL